MKRNKQLDDAAAKEPVKDEPVTIKIKLAVANFSGYNLSDVTPGSVSDSVRATFTGNSRYIVIDRGVMENTFSQKGLPVSGCTDLPCILNMGRAVEVDKVIVGKLTQKIVIQNEVQVETMFVTLVAVDIENARVEFSETVRCEPASKWQPKVNALAGRMMDRLRK